MVADNEMFGDVHDLIFFRPFGAGFALWRDPTAYAVGRTLSPLRG
jgi:hypothetical protein